MYNVYFSNLFLKCVLHKWQNCCHGCSHFHWVLNTSKCLCTCYTCLSLGLKLMMHELFNIYGCLLIDHSSWKFIPRKQVPQIVLFLFPIVKELQTRLLNFCPLNCSLQGLSSRRSLSCILKYLKNNPPPKKKTSPLWDVLTLGPINTNELNFLFLFVLLSCCFQALSERIN